MHKPADPSHSTREKSINTKSVICSCSPCLFETVLTLQAFCHELQKRLQENNNEHGLRELVDRVEDQINLVKDFLLKSLSPHRHAQLDGPGTDLWNLCVQVKRQDDTDFSPAKSKLLVFARVFSFLILALAQRGTHNEPGDLLRLEKLAIKTGRSCIGMLQLRPTPAAALRD